ncbi:MAG: hypothetical protein MUF45_07125 [Spirosomaceae bacterium]|nr:hypothetical protein [Spirosomataceae bacterium]
MNLLSFKNSFTTAIILIVIVTLSQSGVFAQTPQLSWTQTYGWAANYDDFINQSIQTHDGEIVTIGNAVLNDGVESIRVSKVSSKDGHVIWETILQEPSTYTDFKGVSIVQMPDSSFYILGRIPSSTSRIYANRPNELIYQDVPLRIYRGLSEVFLAKLDSKGKFLWFKAFGGSVHDEPRKLLLTHDNKLLIGAATWSNDGDMADTERKGGYDIWLAKVDLNGAIIWKKCYGGLQNEDLSDIVQTSNNDFVLVGKTNSNDQYISPNKGNNDALIIRINSSGLQLWSKTYGGSQADEAKSVIESPDGSIMINSTSISNDGDVLNQLHNPYFEDIWLIKLNGSGSLIWDKTYGGTYKEKASTITLTSQNKIILVGDTGSSNGDVAPGFHPPIGVNTDYLDFWIFEIDNLGNILWQKILGGNHNEDAMNALALIDGSLVVSGKTHSDENGDVVGFEGGEGYDAWMVKIDFTCLPNYQSSETYPSGETLIEVSENITFSGSMVNGAEVIHKAGKSIVFAPGTSINSQQSSTYLAKIGSCGNTNQPSQTANLQTFIYQECRDGGVKMKYEPFSADSTLTMFTIGAENQEARVPYDLINNTLIIKNSGSNSNLLGKLKVHLGHQNYKKLEIDVYAATCQHDNNPTLCPENNRSLTLDKQYYNVGDTIRVTWNGTLEECQTLFWFTNNISFVSQNGKNYVGIVSGLPASLQAQPSNNTGSCNVCHGWTKVEIR